MPIEEIRVGQRVWLNCEVRPGPFSDERLIKVPTAEEGEWVGFVPISSLKDPLLEGNTQIIAIVTEVEEDIFFAKLPGQPISGMPFKGSRALAGDYGSFQT